MNNQKKLWGISLMIFAFSINANAQTCTPPPDCVGLGYTKAASECAESVKCPFDTNKVFCLKEFDPCEIGSILYSDKSCSKPAEAGKTAIGIVFDTNKQLAVALDQVSSTLLWGGYGTDIPDLTNCSSEPLTCGTDGKVNTSAIIAYGKSNGISYPAAEYCNRYTTAGTTTGDWFLPSYADLKSIYNAKTYVNASLQLLGKSAITDSWYWSSTEHSDTYSWILYMNNGEYTSRNKNGKGYVLSVIAY